MELTTIISVIFGIVLFVTLISIMIDDFVLDFIEAPFRTIMLIPCIFLFSAICSYAWIEYPWTIHVSIGVLIFGPIMYFLCLGTLQDNWEHTKYARVIIALKDEKYEEAEKILKEAGLGCLLGSFFFGLNLDTLFTVYIRTLKEKQKKENKKKKSQIIRLEYCHFHITNQLLLPSKVDRPKLLPANIMKTND